MAPTISRTRGEIVGTTAGFTVATDGTADARSSCSRRRERTAPGPASTSSRPTCPTARSGGGAAADRRHDAEFLVQVVDASGNVAVSNNKVSNFLASRLANNGNLAISLVPPTGVTAVNGWCPGQPIYRPGERRRRE